MPNWCDNSLTVSHEDKEMMQKFAAAVAEGNLFMTFVPPPDGEWDYGWCVDNWGTKWDVSSGEFCLEEDGLSGSGWFNTAWGPPIMAYESLQELGFSIDALYHECGMGFAGSWVDGEENCVDNYYEMFQEENWKEQVGNEDLLNLLEAEYENWLESNSEDEEEE
jgi:hypothetical protein